METYPEANGCHARPVRSMSPAAHLIHAHHAPAHRQAEDTIFPEECWMPIDLMAGWGRKPDRRGERSRSDEFLHHPHSSGLLKPDCLGVVSIIDALRGMIIVTTSVRLGLRPKEKDCLRRRLAEIWARYLISMICYWKDLEKQQFHLHSFAAVHLVNTALQRINTPDDNSNSGFVQHSHGGGAPIHSADRYMAANNLLLFADTRLSRQSLMAKAFL